VSQSREEPPREEPPHEGPSREGPPQEGPPQEKLAHVELLEVAKRTAAMAGEALAERFHNGTERALGSKSSPTDLVSEADLEAERMIREALEEMRPDDGVLGEEGDDRQGSSGLRWVVDPLDGTVNFLLGIPQWCVSVAVRDGDGPLAGAIYDPIRDEMFGATRGGPAVLEAPEMPALPYRGTRGSRSETPAMPYQGTRGSRSETPALPYRGTRGSLPEMFALHPGAHGSRHEKRSMTVHERADLANAMVATGLAYGAEVRAAQAEVLARLVPRVRDIRRFGSAALDLAWTAAGRYDAYFERSVKPWDVEAGVLICARAGLRVVELAPDGVLPWGVLAATPRLADPLLELVG
jgi:myo-inositol-1(or 4)-monophosphatase